MPHSSVAVDYDADVDADAAVTVTTAANAPLVDSSRVNSSTTDVPYYRQRRCPPANYCSHSNYRDCNDYSSWTATKRTPRRCFHSG